uniref:Uncharacterized protein n=1 Tax=Sphaerodactylus townsendi TaxID=933632 RepID=A0ACB8G6Q3_9SAUR
MPLFPTPRLAFPRGLRCVSLLGFLKSSIFSPPPTPFFLQIRFVIPKHHFSDLASAPPLSLFHFVFPSCWPKFLSFPAAHAPLSKRRWEQTSSVCVLGVGGLRVISPIAGVLFSPPPFPPVLCCLRNKAVFVTSNVPCRSLLGVEVPLKPYSCVCGDGGDGVAGWWGCRFLST